MLISKESEQVCASAGSGLVKSYPIFISIEDISSSPSDKSNNDIKLLTTILFRDLHIKI